jgi:hypothetical protein
MTDSRQIVVAPPATRTSPRALRWALAWAVLFTVMHGYWYLGGTIGLGDAPSPLPGVPDSAVGWVFTIVVVAIFAAGLAVPIVLLRDRRRGGFRRTLVLLLWIGCVVLVLRGGSGLLDDIVRDVGLSSRGITGMSYEDTLGTADPSTYTLSSTAVIDAFFLLGGVLYGWAARTTAASAGSRHRCT